MCLHAEPPARMRHAIARGRAHVFGRLVAPHRLQQEMLEGERPETAQAPRPLADKPASTRSRAVCTSSAPAFGLTQIQSMPGRRLDRPVGLDRDLETARVHRIDQRVVELQQRLAAGEDDIALAAAVRRPLRQQPRRASAAAFSNLPPPSPSVPTKSRVAERAYARRRDPPRAPSTDCSRRSGRTRPARPARMPSPCSV